MDSTEQMLGNSEFAAISGYSSASVDKSILFYIELFEESSAYYMAARLQKENWEINIIPIGSCWICHAHAVITPDMQTILDLSNYLADLAEYYGGTFKRWELKSTL